MKPEFGVFHFSKNSMEDCTDWIKLNLFTPMSDQGRVSPYNINQISDENKERYQFGDKLI